VIRSVTAFALAFLAVALVFVPLESLVAAIPSRRGRRQAILTDGIYWFFTPLVTKPFSKATTVVIAALVVASVGLPFFRWMEGLRSFWDRQPPWLSFAAMMVICDLCAYWAHRLFHSRAGGR